MRPTYVSYKHALTAVAKAVVQKHEARSELIFVTCQPVASSAFRNTYTSQLRLVAADCSQVETQSL